MPSQLPRVIPRTRPKLRVDDADLPSPVEKTVPPADSHRFADLDPREFWENVLEIPRTIGWAAAHAAAVAELRATDGRQWTARNLAEHFGVTAVTIRKAIRLAAGLLQTEPPQGDGCESKLTLPPPRAELDKHVA